MVTLSAVLASADPGVLHRRARRWLAWRRAPFTCVYLAVLGIGTIVLGCLDGGEHEAVLRLSSTDVRNLSAHPIFVLIG